MTIIEKIKKLLRLSRSSNPHEAELALAKAMALAAEHRVALESIDPDDDRHVVGHTHTDPWRAITKEKKYASIICQTFFNVTTFTDYMFDKGSMSIKRRICFVGTVTDRQIALYVFGFLVQHFRYCWRHHRGRCRSRDSYLAGMYTGIFSKLIGNPQTTAKPGLAMVPSHRAYIARHFGELFSSNQRKTVKFADSAFRQGFVQGLKTNIRKGVKTTIPKTHRIT